MEQTALVVEAEELDGLALEESIVLVMAALV
jgi:hypothetical protein